MVGVVSAVVEEAVVERTPTKINLGVSLGVKTEVSLGVRVRVRPTHVTKGLVMGEILRISYLCSREEDIQANLRKFYRRLCASGHNEKTLSDLFTLGIENAEKYMAMSPLQRQQLREEKREASKRRVYLKIPFHPSDPQ